MARLVLLMALLLDGAALQFLAGCGKKDAPAPAPAYQPPPAPPAPAPAPVQETKPPPARG